MRILVTGTSGFVGGSLAPKLAEEGHDIYCLERYVTGRFVLGKNKNMKTVFGDLRDDSTIKKIIRDTQPEAVIHLAAISPVSYSYDHPIEVSETNFFGTVNLAEACLKEAHHFKHFLFAGTSEEYGNQINPPIKENSELYPNSPYAVSKVAADKYLQYMKDTYDFPITVLRNFNTYGRKDNSHFVVERTIVQMLQGQTVRLGDPEPIRDLMYLDDHLNGYLTCLDNDKAIGETFNFCTGFGIKISDLVERIRQITGFSGNVVWNTIPKRPLDIDVLIGDNSKARKLLNWQPKVGIEQGLRLTADCLKTILDKTQFKFMNSAIS